MSTLLSETTGLSDCCALADGAVVIGRWSENGLADSGIVKVAAGYTETVVGALGPRAIIRLDGVTVDAMAMPAGTVRGVISLHPDGYALVQVTERVFAIWQRAGDTWSEVARGEETTAGYAARPGTYRLEVFDGALWALPCNSAIPQTVVYEGGGIALTSGAGGQHGFVLRGSALVPIIPPYLSLYERNSLPVPVVESYSLTGGILVAGQTTAYQAQARWRGAWWYRGGHDVEMYGVETPWFNLLHSFLPQSVLADATAVYGVGLNTNAFRFAQEDWPATCPEGAKAGEWARYDGQRLLRADLDCFPLAGRTTAGTLWMLGVDAAGMFPFSVWAQAITGEEGFEDDSFATRADLLVPTALYRTGTPDPEVGVLVSGSADESTDGYYAHQDDLTISDHDVWVQDDGEHWIIWDGTQWIIVDAPAAIATGTETAADQSYTVTGELVNGYPVYLSADGLYEIIFDGTQWVLVAVADPTTVLYSDGDGGFPWDGAWIVVEGEGETPTVTQGELGAALETDGTGPVPWVWPEAEVVPPAETEGVCWYSQTDIERPARAVRVTVQGPLADESNVRAIVGVTEPTALVDWTLYQAAPWGCRVALSEAADTVYIGIIGALAENVPPVEAVLERCGE